MYSSAHNRQTYPALLALIALILPEQASGQAADPNTTVTQRPNPAYDPINIRAGSFLIAPELQVSSLYTDNVGFEEEDEDSDFSTLIEPSVGVQSNWSVHSLAFEAGGEFSIHQQEDDEDYQDAFARSDLQLEISRRQAFGLGLEARKTHVSRDDPEDVGENELTDVFRYAATGVWQQNFNRVNFRESIEVEHRDFKDGEDDQDDITYDFSLRAGYVLSPRIQVFTEGRYNIDDRIQNVDDDGFERDSDGYEIRVGSSVDITSLLFGEAFAGYRTQRFDDDNFGNETGVSFGANLSWNPTLLTSLNLTASRDFEATDEAGAASNFTTSIQLTVDHELLRNVIVSGNGFYENDDFRGDDRKEDAYGAGVGVEYLLNRNVALNAGYDFSKRDSNVAGESFEANIVQIGLTLRL